MNTEIWRRLSDKHMNLAQRLGDRIFVLCLLCTRLLADLIRGVIMACLVTIAPAIFFTWILFDVAVIPPGGKVFLVAFLTLGSCFLLSCVLGPLYSRIKERSESLDSVIDAWLKREQLSGACRGTTE